MSNNNKTEATSTPIEVKESEQRKCVTCGSTKTAKRMNGKERWHLFGATESEGWECHKCYTKATRQAKKELLGEDKK